MITFLEDERRFMYVQINERYQDWNFRSVEGDLLQGLLTKLQSVTVSFTEAESRFCQYLFEGLKTVYSRLHDVQIQHLIQGESGKMSGVGGPAVMAGPGGGGPGNGASSYFNGPATYLTCVSILAKLVGS